MTSLREDRQLTGDSSLPALRGGTRPGLYTGKCCCGRKAAARRIGSPSFIWRLTRLRRRLELVRREFAARPGRAIGLNETLHSISSDCQRRGIVYGPVWLRDDTPPSRYYAEVRILHKKAVLPEASAGSFGCILCSAGCSGPGHARAILDRQAKQPCLSCVLGIWTSRNCPVTVRGRRRLLAVKWSQGWAPRQDSGHRTHEHARETATCAVAEESGTPQSRQVSEA